MKVFFKFLILFILLTVVSLYSFWFSLDTETIRNYTEVRLQKILNELPASSSFLKMNVVVGKVNTLWTGFELEEIQLTKTQERQLTINKVKFNLFEGLFSFAVPITCRLLNGEVEVNHYYFSDEIAYQAKNIDLNLWPAIRSSKIFEKEAIISFKGRNNVTDQSIEIIYLSKNLNLNGENTLFPIKIPDITITKLEGTLNAKEDAPYMIKALLNGDINTELVGDIWVDKERFTNSKIHVNLKGNISDKLSKNILISELLAKYIKQNNLNLKITGTLGAPKIG